MATPNDTTKVCSKCGAEYPATPEYFHNKGRGDSSLRSKCKRCVSKERATGNKITRFEKEELASQGLRRCSKCRTVYPFSANYFPRTPQTKDGLSSWCKKCADQWRLENQEVLRQYRLEEYWENPEIRRKRSRDYYHEHREERIEYNHNYYEENRPKLLEKKKQYAVDNPDKVRFNWENMRSNRRKADGRYTKKDLIRLHSNQRGKCYWCGCNIEKYHVDHVIAVSLGGSNYPHNLVLSCGQCNQSKTDKLPWIWRKSLYWLVTLSFVQPATITCLMMITLPSHVLAGIQ